MIQLSEQQKQIFETNVEQITSKDVQNVLDNIDQELKNLQSIVEQKPSVKTEELIANSKLLAELIRCVDFPITESSRKWIVFALNYLISDIDLIPDSIPIIGYLDDALVVSWVKNLVDSDITRFAIFKKAKEVKHIIKQVLQGDGHTEVILIPGFLSNEFYADHYKEWIRSLTKSKLGKDKPGVSIFDWKTNYTPEFQNTILIVDHELKLKPKYNSEVFATEWEQLKRDFHSLSKVFFSDLQKIKKQQPDKKIIVIAINVGTFTIDNPHYSKKLSLIDDYYIFGGCSKPEYILGTMSKKIKNIYNFYNYQDAALQFIYDNFENMEKPIGLKAIYVGKTAKIKNISCGVQHRRHTTYKDLLTKLIDAV
ncbi:MAG TPA: DUF1232 domain-containing protein [Bacteroidales bacterium]|nr:DUF1232 domain-containing protein [Bacteroidales bacterium]